MPLFVVLYLKSNVVLVGIVSSVSSAASVPALIFWGNISDRIKKRKIFILIGFFGSFASLMLVLTVHNITSYLIMLIAFQIIAMASVPVSTLLILENSSRDLWPSIMGKFNSYNAIGTVAGIGSGIAFLTLYSYKGSAVLPYVYIISAMVYLAAGISSIFTLKEPQIIIKRNRLNWIYTVRLFERLRFFPTHIIHTGINSNGHKISMDLKRYLVVTFILMAAFQIFFVPYPVFVLKRFSATDNEIYIMYLLNSLMSAITFFPAGKYIKYIGSNRMLIYSVSLRAVIFTVMGILTISASGLYYFILFILVYGMLGGIWSFISISEITSISNMADKNTRGKVIGYYNSLNGAGQIFGSLLSGFIAYDISYLFDFILSSLIIVSMIVYIIKMNPPDISVKIRPSRVSQKGEKDS
nr:MFS transporter [Picrophilus oshimae]